MAVKDSWPLAGLMLAAAVPALADEAPVVASPGSVSVVANRVATDAEDTATNVSLVPRSELDRRQVVNTKDVFKLEPNVSLPTELIRRGNGSVTIRGIEGNRVLMLVDGVRLPDEYRGGGSAISGRDLLDPDSLAGVELVKGPFSGAYGSDAMGGVVALRTLRPEDVATEPGKVAFRAKASFDGQDQRKGLSATLAWRNQDWATLLQLVRREGEERQNQGSNDASDLTAKSKRTTPNPQDWNSTGILATLERNLGQGHRLSLTLDHFRRYSQTNLLSERGVAAGGGPVINILDSQGDDRSERSRLGLGYEYDGNTALFDHLKLNTYIQQLRFHETASERRSNNRLRLTDSRFEQDMLGMDVQFQKGLQWGSVSHDLVYGLDVSRTETRRPRDRSEINLATGTINKTVAGETYPSKIFPDAQVDRIGVFMQDAIALSDRFTLQPALRYDRYRLRLSPDADFARANTSGQKVQDYSDSAWTPKLAMQWKLDPHLTLFGQLAAGFRNPPYDATATAFVNAAGQYEIFPNAALKAERSKGMELGLRGQWDSVSFSATAFQTRYRDFIEAVPLNKGDTNGNGISTEYRNENIGRVRTRGLELRADWAFMRNWTLRTAYGYTRGQSEDNGAPLNSVDPAKFTLGLAYANADWGLGLDWVHVDAQRRVADATGSQPVVYYRTPSFNTLDLSGHVNLGKQTTLRFGIYNLTNRKYWLWSDVRGVAANSTVLDRYTQPGRTFAVSLEARF
ncbi:TonB-dependent hemoglobin/transferrin/lactoferrin family receptor [Leeia aquatica]|uniref:TonB-dependent hemoglobin/transferrin/lactoferrin family receptor n=1 Tax=Leeia aquatica TaxID=2725557 RepID=A0A847SE38_9NEIS|nr:TonB-dependent hemoglobin/transferrin/lactoferrin family receptor [Leeia aquatica]NLR75706.1 TonB-dependent hemoglobin/transferrin/lactoferrin family receptor [Leeia aquatica]